MMDRAGGGKRVLAPFLGKGTHIPLGPARLACRTDSAVVLGASRRREDGTIAIRFSQLRTDEVREPEKLSRIVAAAIEAEVRTVPEQWLWIYRGQPDWSGEAVAPAGSRARAADS
jgi:lauroyl/myristoyl acyltransferase